MVSLLRPARSFTYLAGFDDGMTAALQLHTYQWGAHRLQLYVPRPAAVQQQYEQQKAADPATPFPYWTQVWPAAIALSGFLVRHPHFVHGKTVLELAAGLGLPSLVAALFARQVCCSDYLPEAVAVVQQSVEGSGLQHVCCRVLNWHHLPDDIAADVLLLSDVNYAPEEFEVLYAVLTRFLASGTTILLSTPQRLMAKPFVERLLPWCVQQEVVVIPHGLQEVRVSVLVLKG